jgi:HD superfamily phosphohydrolase
VSDSEQEHDEHHEGEQAPNTSSSGAEDSNTAGRPDQPPSLSIPELIEALQKKYEAHDRLRAHSATELPILRAWLEELMPQLAPRYQPLGVFTPGGGGVPILLRDSLLRDQQCVLKLPRPIIGREVKLNRILAQEADRLSEVRHPNVIRILVSDSMPTSGTPYYIMECVPDAQDADVYLSENNTVESLLHIVEGAITALAKIHELGIVHTDVKPANLFVDAAGHTLLADFGFAKRTNAPDPQTRIVGGTSGYIHHEQVILMAEASADEDASDPMRQATAIDIPIDRNRIKPYWDLYSLGITFFVLLDILEEHSPRTRRDFRVRYLRLMAYRLIGQNLAFAKNNTLVHPGLNIADTIFGLTSRDTEELQYETMAEVLFDLQKLLGTRDLIRDVPEVGRHQADMIQASSHGPASFTERVRRIVHTPEVRRLGSITQLGLVNQVYPTASHTRLEHTLGTFSMACRYVRALYNDPVNPIFKQIMRADDIEALLLACLVHDVGHYPLAHDLEEVEPRVFGHDVRTQRLVTNAKTSLLARTLADPENGWNTTVDRVVALLQAGTKPEDATFRNSVLSAIIDGPIDADKLDYLIRDAENLRLPYGRGIDFDRLISSATVVMIPRRSGEYELERFPSLGIHERGRIAAESVAFARYAMYGAVYWHRTHRTLKAMLNRIAYEALYTGPESEDAEARRKRAQELRTKLHAFLDVPLQYRLRVAAAGTGAGYDDGTVDGGFLDAGTEQVLDWLTALNQATTSGLADDIRRRRLYDRVLVTSEYRNSALPWDGIKQAFGPRGDRDRSVWLRRLKFARIMETHIASMVRDWDGTIPDSQTAIDPTRVELFQAQVHARPVILVDYPMAKLGSKHALSFLYENEWRDPEMDGFEAVAANQSPIWKAVGDQLQESLSKLRVYCDPDFSGLVSAAVPRTEMERLIAVSLDELEQA